VRYVPVATNTQRLIQRYLEMAKHGEDLEGPLFRPVSNNTAHRRRKALSAGAVYQGGRQALRPAGGDHRRRARLLRALAQRDGGDERARAQRRHCQGAGVAGARERVDHQDLR
jgi:hypothetical protein